MSLCCYHRKVEKIRKTEPYPPEWARAYYHGLHPEIAALFERLLQLSEEFCVETQTILGFLVKNEENWQLQSYHQQRAAAELIWNRAKELNLPVGTRALASS